ncbi:BPI/LBP/CETP N-terminal domain protein [Volvox carteri f. nagariensis]|uniref:BPI/LBP/CETP N-terminal domain protein n=1 Tax=Volvox carteri f. nagariensis TaxID=3068 RepID=D8THR0_VOLCA|nr:BPI/LBP/CETP N-terminal domain protein [Volvox carteri f. nagariensis]EFJ52757.1 BPI/LBP/CETP N-terminal domain protein [Volvox carteri f. nagariensis]|eukprot:XP_002945762.1 BPI/LBP/CETP N-terminal domain protein [Volvox carteri f. nagariensis]
MARVHVASCKVGTIGFKRSCSIPPASLKPAKMTGRTWMLCIVVLTLGYVSLVQGFPLINRFRSEPLISATDERSSVAAVSSTMLTGASLELSKNSPAGIAIGARQRLFDYSIGVAFMFLSQKLQGQSVPDVSKRFSIPVVGSFDLQLTNIVVTDFACSASSANLTILGDGFFHLLASDIAANLTFQWHWTKGALSGSGEGELMLSGGTIDWVYEVHKDEQLQKPQLLVVTANSNFDSVDIKIHSYSADWLYQAVLTLFNEAVKRQVQRIVASALDNDVPDRINAVLGSLPTRLDVRGLPFSASFEYSIYTAAFVLVKGFGEVEVPQAPTADAAAAGAVAGADGWPAVVTSRRRYLRGSQQRHRRLGDVGVDQMTECPFETSQLPLNGVDIAADGSQVSIYVHEATVNCLLWGLYGSGKLALSVRDGTIPGLIITTDVLSLLVPELPKKYPHQRMIINVEALDVPSVSFGADNTGATLSAYYRLSLVVANESLGNPEVVRLAANLTLNGAFDWDSTDIREVTARHVVEVSELSVPAEQWDNTVMWLLESYGPLLSLRQVVEMAVRTPITSMVSLARAQAATWERWYALSTDVELRLPPPAVPKS